MRLAFLCSSLEPGRDGVGDYTRRLATELIRQGHECRLLSLNDKSSQLPAPRSPLSAFQHCQESEGTDVLCLRLPSLLGLSERISLARQWLAEFKPDWISLQYVCYGYHPRGLAWRWNSVFDELGYLAKHRHLMLHELWIGPPPLHRWVIGWGQQRVIRDLHRRFQPELVTTTMPTYEQRLSGIGIQAKVLPLFGNIPIVACNDESVVALLQAAGSLMAQRPRDSFLNGVFFGAIHANFDAAPLIHWLGELQRMANRPVLLTMIGRGGAAAKQLADKLCGIAEVMSLGEQPEVIISQTLQFADFGINTGSPELLGKSGTFAAMQEHGLPVVLGEGELDLGYSQYGILPPVLQFSIPDSPKTLLNHRRPAKQEAGVIHAARDMICLLGTAHAGNHSTIPAELVKS